MPVLNFTRLPGLLKNKAALECTEENMSVLLDACSFVGNYERTQLKAIKKLDQFIRHHLSDDAKRNIPNIESVFSKLVVLLEHRNAKVQSGALDLLFYLAQSNSQHSYRLARANYLPKVVGLLSSGALLTSFNAILLLNHLSKNSLDQIIQARTIPILMQWLDTHEEFLIKIYAKKPRRDGDYISSEKLIVFGRVEDVEELKNVDETTNEIITRTNIILDTLDRLIADPSRVENYGGLNSVFAFKTLFKFLQFEDLQPLVTSILLKFRRINSELKSAVLDQFYSKNNAVMRKQLRELAQAKQEAPLFEFLQQWHKERFKFLERVHENNYEEAMVLSTEWHKVYSSGDFEQRRKLLGKGSFGEVFKRYLVHELRKKVVIKQLKLNNHMLDSKKILINFACEALIHSHLAHENIITFLGVYLGQGVKGIVLERADQALDKKIDRARIGGDILPWPQRIKIALEIASALEHVHQLSWFHGDISSGNILLMSDGTAKLSDFGLARPYRPEEKIFGGTPRYMAPDVLLCWSSQYQGCSLASDVYSFAIFLAELSCWALPWGKEIPKSEDEVPMLRVFLTDDKRPAISEKATVEFKEMLAHSWCTVPGDRYTMTEIISKLGSLASRNSPLTVAISPGECDAIVGSIRNI